MIITPVRGMCGAGLISGFFQYVPDGYYLSEFLKVKDRHGLDLLFEESKNFSGHDENRMFDEKKGMEEAQFISYTSDQEEFRALQMLYCITKARFPTYSIYTSTEVYYMNDLFEKLGFKPLKDFVNPNSSNRCYVYNIDQSELHDKLLEYCKMNYNKGWYRVEGKNKFFEEAVLYILDEQAQYSHQNPEEEGEDYDDEDYYEED